MNFLKKNHPKSRAQAMVEFAIVLPILLLLLYGILETGRFLFIYSSTVTASRQAARYGSATGAGLATTSPRFQDCAGIRDAAKAAAYISTIDDSEIVIEYDTGPSDTAPKSYCDGNPAPTAADLSDNKHRILVTVTDHFEPILPNLIPFTSRDIEIKSARTVIISVAIEVTPPFTPTYTFTPTFTPSLTFTPSITPTSSLTPTITQTLQYTYTPSKTPTAAPSSTATLPPTITPIPPTAITGCNTVTTGLIQKSGNSLTMTITNPLNANLEVSEVTVRWNHDKGHQTGNDKSLILQSASLAGTTFFNGSDPGPSTSPPIVPSPAISIPGNNATSTITFTFNQSYDNWDNTEFIEIRLLNIGCLPLTQNQHQP